MRNSTIARPLSCRFQGKLPTGPALPPSERLRAFATPCELFATRGCELSPTDFVGVAMNTAAWRRTSRRNYAALTIAALAGLFGGVLVAPSSAASASSPWVAFQASLRDGQFGDDGVFLVR